MALIKCPECGHDVSDKADICANCGFKIKDTENLYELSKQKEDEINQEQNEKNETKNTILSVIITVVVIVLFGLFLCFWTTADERALEKSKQELQELNDEYDKNQERLDELEEELEKYN